MVAVNLNQGFPSINTPFVDLDPNSPRYGMMNQAWYQLLIALWNRTGQGGGSSPEQAMILALAQGADESCDQGFATAFDVGGAEEPPTPPDEAVLMSLAFADDTSGTLDQSAVFPSGITVYGGAAIFNGEAISGGLYIVDTGINIHAGGETVHGGLVAFGGAAVSGGLIVTDTGLNVQAGGETVIGGAAIFGGQAVAGGLVVTSGGLSVQAGGETVVGGLVSTGATQCSGGLGVGTIFGPQADNTISCGIAALRFTDIYAVSGSVNPSDISLKTNISPLPPCLPIVLQVDPIAWDWAKTEWKDGLRHFGFDAQKLDQVVGLPNWAGHLLDSEGIHNLRPHEILPILWQAVRELAQETQPWP